jgi:hypothetical protein
MERAKLHRNVVVLELVCQFTDLSSEMIYALLLLLRPEKYETIR